MTTGRMRARVLAWALVAAVGLSGCTIPFVNVEVPLDLPSIKLPQIDLSKLPLPEFSLPVGVTSSVEEARQEQQAKLAPTISDEALVMPGYLSVGVKTASSSAPLCVEGEGGTLSGIDVDLAAALASEMGLPVRYLSVSDTSSLGTECDIIMDERSDNPNEVAIAGAYVESATSFFHKGDAGVVVPTDLGGKSVGVQGGSASEGALNNAGLKMSQKPYANLNEAFEALAKGEVDYVLCEAYPGAYLASKYGNISFCGTLEAPKTAGIAVVTTNTELLEAVRSAFETVSSNGVLEGLRAKWVGSLPVLTIDAQIKGIGGEQSEAAAVAQPTVEGDADGSEAGGNAVTGIAG